ncbi:hypothetical protein ACE2AJ_17225 [Aquihabitans daechungensis]|uniref:hypothetical protein n=1 Tax=Aquihabitans daechungensis TaxID=1052257 RepID=UPI003BA165C4
MTDQLPGPGRLSRRDLLRWAGIAGAAAVVPVGLAGCRTVTTPSPLKPDPSVRGLGFVGGTDTVIGQGGWCWFQAPRSSMGPDGVVWLGSTIGHTFTDADGTIQATAFDSRSRSIVRRIDLAKAHQDDHTSPSVLALGNAAQISWATHQRVDYLDVGDARLSGSFEAQRIRRPGAIKAPGRGMAYTSAHVVNGQRWLLYRGEQFSWNLLVSVDDGSTWTAKGLVVAPGAAGVRPYVHAASDGRRLHIVVTDGNPTEYRGNSAYAGTVESDLSIRRADGATVGKVGSTAPTPKKLTRLAAGVAGAEEAADSDLWLSDLCVVDNRPTGVLVRRDPWPDEAAKVGNYRHRYLWIRQRAAGWTVEHLCWAGGELCNTQPDYPGLAAQDPSDPTRVVVSTNVHPVTAEPLVSSADGLVHFELFEGRRTGEGQWTFAAVTENSVEDNMRPSIAAGGPDKTLSWMRGKYWSWIAFNTRIVVRSAVVAPAGDDPPTPTPTSTPPVPPAPASPDPSTTTTTGPPELGYHPA